MLIKLLKGKLHEGRVTGAHLHYSGSIKIDPELLEVAGIVPYESVIVADVNNGNRLETYVVPAEAGSRDIIILGAAAQLIKQGDTVIIMNFGFVSEEEAKVFKPKVVLLDENNQIKQSS